MSNEHEQWMKLARPGPHHEILKRMEGTFDSKARFWMAPGAPPMDSTGRMVNTLLLGGRVLEHKYKGTMMGSEFEGWGSLSFDNISQQYTGVWMDTMATMIQLHTGPAGADPSVLDLRGEFTLPMGVIQSRHLTRVLDRDHMVFEIHQSRAGQPEALIGRIEYTRAN